MSTCIASANISRKKVDWNNVSIFNDMNILSDHVNMINVASCKMKVNEKNKLNDMWFFKSILHLENANEYTSRRSQIERRENNNTQTTNWQEVDESLIITLTSSKKIFSFMNIEIMCLKIDEYTIQETLEKQLFSQKSDLAILSSITRRRSVNVLLIAINQDVNINAFSILRYKSFEKRSRERSRNIETTTITRTQNDELWIHRIYYQFYNTYLKQQKKHHDTIIDSF